MIFHGGPDKKEILAKKRKLFSYFFKKDESEARLKGDQLYYVSTDYVEQFNALCLHRQSSLKAMNFDIVQSQTSKTLKKQLEKDRDYFLVTKQVLKILSLNQKYDLILPYKQMTEQKEPNPEIYYVNYIELTRQTVLDIKRTSKPSKFLKKQSLEIDPSKSINDLIEKLKKQLQRKNIKIRLWKCSPDDIKDDELLKKYQYIYSSSREIPGIGQLIESDLNPNKTSTLQNLGLKSDELLIAQIIHYRDNWFMTNQKKCPRCYKASDQCNCKVFQSCISTVQRYNSPPKKGKSKNQITFKAYSRRGLTGLENIGNTCYMNSCLQCLSHTVPLTEYFLKEYYKNQINSSSTLGTSGQLPIAYADFIKNMWLQQDKTYAPRKLKKVLSNVNPMYTGSFQHDSYQLLTFLVDQLNEDFNRITMKPKNKPINSSGRPDEIVAKQYWTKHTSKKQSIITDFMTGQFKSKFTCLDCHTQSVKFESFTTIPLPIEQGQSGWINYCLMYSNLNKPSERLTYKYNRVDPELWVKDITKALDQKFSVYKLYLLSDKNFYNVEECPKDFLIIKMQLPHQFYLFERRIDLQKTAKPIELFIEFKIPKTTFHYHYQSISATKRLMMFQQKKLFGKDIKEAILRQIYPLYRKSNSINSIKPNQFASALLQSNEKQVYMSKMERESKKLFQLYLKFYKVYSPKQSRIYQFSQKITNELDIRGLFGKNAIYECQLEVDFNPVSLQFFQFDPLLKTISKPMKKMYSPEPQVSLEQCLMNFTEQQTLKGQNQLYCDHCQKPRPTTKQMSIYKTPQILVLQLKRFKQSFGGYRQKNNIDVLFSHDLDMTNYVIDKQPMSSYQQLLKSQPHYKQPPYEISGTDSKLDYELYAVINHYGTLDGGHYTAMAKNKQSWYKFNDRYCDKINENEVFSEEAYVLFYQRKNKGKLI